MEHIDIKVEALMPRVSHKNKTTLTFMRIVSIIMMREVAVLC